MSNFAYPYRARYDEHRALHLALREELLKLRFHRELGAVGLAFSRVLVDPGETLEQSDFPAVVLDTVGDGAFDARSLTPYELQQEKYRLPVVNPQYALFVRATYVEQLRLVVYAPDHALLSEIGLALSEWLSPHLDRFGSRMISLPDYYDVSARLTPVSYRHLSPSENKLASNGIHALAYLVQAEVPSCQVATFSGRSLRPRVDLSAGDNE